MRKLRRTILILLLALLMFLGCARAYQSRFAPVGEERYEKNIESIDLSGKPVGDLTQLQAFPNLKQVDLRGTGLTILQYEDLKLQLPGAEIIWEVPFQGGFFAPETEKLTVTALSQEDMAVLPYFTRLKIIDALNCTDYENLHALRQQRPDLEISYQVSLAGTAYDYTVENLTLPGEDVESYFELLPYLTELKTVELTAPLAPAEQVLALLEAFPEITFSWNLALAGIPVNEKTEKLDLTGIPVTVEEMDAVLPYLLNLTYVDMTDCGISNEEMDALNRRYEDIKIVWTVVLGGYYRVRTDITYFMPVQDDFYPSGGEMLYNLRYCTDVIMIDLGHRHITNCDFVAYMPHLKYLILADTGITDLSPLTGLTELVYLEIFMLGELDFTPLTTLTGLEDLNLCFTEGDPNIIAQITWLNNLWWNHMEQYRVTRSEQEMLRQAIPGCNFSFGGGSSTGGGWRNLPNYYAQRDAAGAHYMWG